MFIWIIAGVALLLLVVLMVGYPRLNCPRRAVAEGIEDADMVQAYNRISRWPQFRFLRRMIVSEVMKHNPQGTIVDVGCGPGYLLGVMAKLLPNIHMVGVDISEEMLQMAKHNLSALGFERRVILEQGDVQQLPFEDGTVDFVVSTFSLHHWAEPKRALQEIHRILKPGGQFIIFDLRRDSRRFFYWLLCFATKFVVPAVMGSDNEPLNSALSSYTIVESEALLAESPFHRWKIKSGIGWLFLWGGKAELERQ